MTTGAAGELRKDVGLEGLGGGFRDDDESAFRVVELGTLLRLDSARLRGSGVLRVSGSSDKSIRSSVTGFSVLTSLDGVLGGNAGLLEGLLVASSLSSCSERYVGFL